MLRLPDALEIQVQALLARSAPGAPIVLPGLQGLPPGAASRHAYRHWVERGRATGPLVQPGAHLDGEAIELARGGWLSVESETISAELAREALDADVQILLEGPPTVELSAEQHRVLLDLEHAHLVAIDPSLSEMRRALRSHCQNQAPVLLEGEPGTGRGLLVTWAHATLDNQPLCELQGDGSPEPGRWVLVGEAADLSERSIHGLLDLLRRRARPVSHRHLGRGRRPAHPAFEPIIGQSAPLCELLEEVLRVGPSPLSVLILGEPGVGKEAIARALHALSGRTGPLVPVDLGAIPESLAESELFGHRKGAFSGADRDRKGFFREADGGTLFLDELGNLPPSVQARLLRVLQEREVRPVGADRAFPVDVRLVAATNADPERLVRLGAFRRDLLDRVNTVTLRVPPLRDRAGDLPLIAAHLLAEARGGLALQRPWATEAALATLGAHSWPGNVRELANIMRYAAAMTRPDQPIDARHLGPLAPERNRAVPVLLLARAGSDLSHLPADLRVNSARVPPLRERGPAALRVLILALLRGCALSPDALALLASHPWYGNLDALSRAMARLKEASDGARIDARWVAAILPEVLSAPTEAPIRVVLLPARGRDGRVDGLQKELRDGAILLGRVPDLGTLRAHAADARVATWLSSIERQLGALEPGCLDLSFQPKVSRAQALVLRRHDALAVHALPNTGLTLWAGPLDRDSALRPVPADTTLEVGVALELQLRARGGEVELQLFLFAGAVAFEEHGREAAARADLLRTGGATEVHDASLSEPTAPSPRHERPEPEPERPEPERHQRVWELSLSERDFLVQACLRYREGDWKAHLLGEAELVQEDPALGRLVSWLRNAPRVAQYVARLFSLPANGPLRDALRAALDQDLRGPQILEALPKGVRDALDL